MTTKSMTMTWAPTTVMKQETWNMDLRMTMKKTSGLTIKTLEMMMIIE